MSKKASLWSVLKGWSCCCWSEEASADSTPSWGKLSGIALVLHPLGIRAGHEVFMMWHVCRLLPEAEDWDHDSLDTSVEGGQGGGQGRGRGRCGSEGNHHEVNCLSAFLTSVIYLCMYYRPLHLLTKKVVYKKRRRKSEPRALEHHSSSENIYTMSPKC